MNRYHLDGLKRSNASSLFDVNRGWIAAPDFAKRYVGPQARSTGIQYRFAIRRVAPMKKIIPAILAALMLAGALCAISGATPLTQYNSVAIVGEGTSPFPVML